MASDYVTVRPVLAEVPVAEAEGGYVLVPDNGHSQAAGSHPIRSERPPSQVRCCSVHSMFHTVNITLYAVSNSSLVVRLTTIKVCTNFSISE